MSNNFDNIINKINKGKQFYLATFGAFVGSNIIGIMIRRNNKLSGIRNIKSIVCEEFQNSCMAFMIENPQYFSKKVTFPYIKTLISLKLIKNSPDMFKLVWLSDDAFIDIAGDNRLNIGRSLGINTVHDMSYLTEDGQEFPQYSEKDIAFAMMEAFDYNTLKVGDNWFQILEERESKKALRKKSMPTFIIKALSPRLLSRSLASDDPTVDEHDDDLDGSKGVSQPDMTIAQWNMHVRYMVKIIFSELGIHDYKTALDHYTKIHGAMGALSANSTKSKKECKRIINAVSKAAKWLTDAQKGKKAKSYMRNDEIIHAIHEGVLLQMQDMTRSNRVYDFAYKHVDASMKELKRRKLSDATTNYVKQALFQEAIICRYEHLERAKFITDCITELNFCNVDEANMVRTIKALLAPTHFSNTTVTKNHFDTKISSPSNTSGCESAQTTVPFNIKEVGISNKNTLTVLASNTIKLLKKIKIDERKDLNQALSDDFIDRSISSSEMSYLTDTSLRYRIALIKAERTGNLTSVTKIIDKYKWSAINTVVSYNDIVNNTMTLGRLLCDTILLSTISEDIKTKVAHVILNTLDRYNNDKFNRAKECIPNAIVNALEVAIQTGSHDVANQIFAKPVCTLQHARTHRESLKYQEYLPMERLTKAISNIQCETTKIDTVVKVLALYDNHNNICDGLTALLGDNIKQITHELPQSNLASLSNLLRIYFSQNDIDPYLYMTSCPEWHQPIALEMVAN